MSKKKHSFKGFADPIAIFRTGEHTDSTGKKVTITDDDLAQMVKNYSADSHPYVVGHPEADAPAYGWSAGFTVKDGTLYTLSENVQPEFEAAVESGLFRNRSVAIDKNEDGEWFVRHIGFLGGAAPAIKGLERLNFSGDDAPLHTFSYNEDDTTKALRSLGWAMRSISSLYRSARDEMIERLGLEEADKRAPNYEIDNIVEASNQLIELSSPSAGHMYSHPNLQNQTEVTMSKKDTPAGDKDNAATFTEADVAAKVAAAEEKAAKAAEAKFAHKQRCTDFANKLEADGKILPKDVPAVARFMESQSTDVVLTFTEGEGDNAKEVKLSQFEQAESLFNGLADSYSHLKREECTEDNAPDGDDQPSQFSAPAGTSVDPEGLEIDRKARAFMAKNPDATYLQAVKAVS